MKDREGAALEDLLRPGEVLAGKYRIERILGAGAMGVVTAAYHLDLEQPVAIKLMRPELAQATDAVARFLREARAAARIQSEHVVRIHDVSRLESGAPYIVMEHLSGMDLDHVVRVRGALPIEEAVEYLLQVCEALAEAHAQGIVHRDLKPSNLFLARRADGSALVKVLDFGISKVSRGQAPGMERSLTGTAEVIGTPLYMSPEQVRSLKEVDGRTDIWALGVILHRLLTAGHAFEAENMAACLARIMVDPPVLLRARRPEAPASLEAVILACLEKDRGRRIQDVAELATRLRGFAPAWCQVSVERVVRVLRGKEATAEDDGRAVRAGAIELAGGGDWGGGAAPQAAEVEAEAPPKTEVLAPALERSEGTAPALSTSKPGPPSMASMVAVAPSRLPRMLAVVAAMATCGVVLVGVMAARGWMGGREDESGTSPVSTTTTVVSAAPLEEVSAAGTADATPTAAPSAAPLVGVTAASSASSPVPPSPSPGERLQTRGRTGRATDKPYEDPGPTSGAQTTPAPQGTGASKGSGGKVKKGPIVDSL